jgi:isoquinoline 1-oxidoreductase beta subunit
VRLTRRGLLVGAGVGGGLVVAWSLTRHRAPTPLRARDGELAAGAWIRIAPTGVVSVAAPFCEMGQGIASLIAQVAAVELGADWKQVSVEPVPAGADYGDAVLAAAWAPLWMPVGSSFASDPEGSIARRYATTHPLVVTAQGTALAAFEQPVREAAAAARAMLAKAAASQWGVSWSDCDTRNGAVIHGKQSLAFGKLADAASRFDPPSTPWLRAEPAKDSSAAGVVPFPRLDLPAKVDGSLVFAGDIRLPGMVFAAIAHGPQGDTVLSRHDKAAALAVPGCSAVVTDKRWIAAVAQTWFAADKAVKASAPRFRAHGPVADTAPIEQALEVALQKGKPQRVAAVSDPDALMARPSLTARYDIEPALHAALETPTAVARLRDGKLELWLATQAPEAARKVAAKAAGVPLGDVILYPMHAGGSFDARLDTRIAGEVAVIAKQTGKPVQLMYSRWQDSLSTYPRTPLAAQMAAVVSDDKQTLLGWRTRLAMPATAIESGQRLLHGKDAAEARKAAAGTADPLACAGAMPRYTVPAMAVDHVPVTLGLPTAWYRGNAHGFGAFLTESFVDEVAHFGGREPLAFRMAMLGDEPRLAACLQGVAKLATWGGGGEGSGQGIACHRIDTAGRSGFIAVVATARRDVNGVKVERLSAYADLGRIVNQDIARQQIEGGLVFGMAMTIGGSTGYDKGLPLAGHLGELGLTLLADCPAIDVAFADNAEPPFDPGELSVAAVAPAIANALFSATGLRFRRLPLLSEGL